MSAVCRYFPNQTELTEAIYKVFNENTDLMLKHFTDEENMANIMVTGPLKKAQPLGGLSLATKEQNSDPSNLVVSFVASYQALPDQAKLLFRPMVRALADDIAGAMKRDPGAIDRAPTVADKNMLSFLGSDSNVRELLVNQRGIV